MESLIRAAANAEVPVLITAGKNRARSLAGQIHRRSRRSDRELVIVDCAMPAYRYEQELFQTAGERTGTVLLLEIGELAAWDATPPSCPDDGGSRVAADRRRWPCGSAGRRLIASSTVRLFDSVLRGTFDRDLYYRLNTFQISGT